MISELFNILLKVVKYKIKDGKFYILQNQKIC